jgi:hypothetical protein
MIRHKSRLLPSGTFIDAVFWSSSQGALDMHVSLLSRVSYQSLFSILSYIRRLNTFRSCVFKFLCVLELGSFDEQ